ncbi:MAG TPA: CDP-alcohol phosphatidyltransferase family protein [Gemmatimonadales bacterium]|nr:CDP-alcohol phosphatidyltransferase family protein [Gemmatimonadales bacterium]
MPETSPRVERDQAGLAIPASRAGWAAADLFTALRLPMAVAFVLVPSPPGRLVILALAAGTDLLDGWLARRYGGSRLGAFLDPVADKLFMAAAFGVVALSGRLEWYEILGVLLRDLVTSVAFFATLVTGRAAAVPARVGGKAVTVGQVLTIFAFLLESPLLRPLAWATAAMAIYAIWDYHHAFERERKPL